MSIDLLRNDAGMFSMLAIDQREALRQMMANAQGGRSIADQDLLDFKLDAARILTPAASAVLVDRQFALDEVIEQQVVSPSCALIASADRFHSAHGELVGEVDLDPEVDPYLYADKGVVALKMLVIYRPDQPAAPRVELVERFRQKCQAANLVSIIEPLSRKPLNGEDWDWNQGVLAAAEELGDLG